MDEIAEANSVFGCPLHWQEGTLIFLFKGGKKDPKKWDSYRPISLLRTFYKLWATVQNERLRLVLEDTSSKFQFGYRERTGCGEALQSFEYIVKKCTEPEFCCALLDMTQAFDKCIRFRLHKRLLDLGCPENWVASLHHGSIGTKMRVRFEGEMGESFDLEQGVFQGSPLSPTLWNIYMDGFMEEFNSRCEAAGIPALKLSMGDPVLKWYVETLAKAGEYQQRMEIANRRDPLRTTKYADDTALFAVNKAHLDAQLEILIEVAREWGMEFNRGKTVHLGRGDHFEKKNDVLLGAMVDITGAVTPNVTHRLEKARKIFGALRTPVFCNKELPLKTKLMVFEACVESLYKYSLDSFNISRGTLGLVQSYQSKCLRRIAESDPGFMHLCQP